MKKVIAMKTPIKSKIGGDNTLQCDISNNPSLMSLNDIGDENK